MTTSIYTIYLLSGFLLFARVHTIKKPNIVLFISDDQDIFLKGMIPMVKTNRLIKNEGSAFINTFATTPLCCPSRASILTGMYQHNHQVLNNSLEGGCSSTNWQKTLEKETFAVYLKQSGYSTFYAGKYLNQYGKKQTGGTKHVPPGWDTWIGLVGNSKYYNYTLSVNGKKKFFSKNYLTRVIQSYAYDFIKKHENSSQPLLMVIAPPAPHQPFTPEPKYSGYFEGKGVPRNIQFNYGNNTNKHWLVQMNPSRLPIKTLKVLDEMYARRWETLLSIDDLVESVIQHLDAIKQLENTYTFYTSDNGFHLGQFSLTWDKRQMYEFDIRVPMLVRGPGVPKNVTISTPVILPDIAPTLLHISGIKINNFDGESFLPIKNRTRRFFLLEYHGEGALDKYSECGFLDENVYECSIIADCKCQDAKNNTYFCLRGIDDNDDFIYCQFADKSNFEEIYNIKRDKYQLYNIRNDVNKVCKKKIKSTLKKLMSCKRKYCHIKHHCNYMGCF